MPSGNQPARRDPVMKRKAWFAVFLGSAVFWIIVALVAWNVWGQVMSTLEQRSTVMPSPDDHEQESQRGAENKPNIPASWKLSPEQRSFIDLFADDDDQKQ